jgi:hypothetical protein
MNTENQPKIVPTICALSILIAGILVGVVLTASFLRRGVQNNDFLVCETLLQAEPVAITPINLENREAFPSMDSVAAFVNSTQGDSRLLLGGLITRVGKASISDACKLTVFVQREPTSAIELVNQMLVAEEIVDKIKKNEPLPEDRQALQSILAVDLAGHCQKVIAIEMQRRRTETFFLFWEADQIKQIYANLLRSAIAAQGEVRSALKQIATKA